MSTGRESSLHHGASQRSPSVLVRDPHLPSSSEYKGHSLERYRHTGRNHVLHGEREFRQSNSFGWLLADLLTKEARMPTPPTTTTPTSTLRSRSIRTVTWVTPMARRTMATAQAAACASARISQTANSTQLSCVSSALSRLSRPKIRPIIPSWMPLKRMQRRRASRWIRNRSRLAFV